MQNSIRNFLLHLLTFLTFHNCLLLLLVSIFANIHGCFDRFSSAMRMPINSAGHCIVHCLVVRSVYSTVVTAGSLDCVLLRMPHRIQCGWGLIIPMHRPPKPGLSMDGDATSTLISTLVLSGHGQNLTGGKMFLSKC